jgi:hypothetical protein
VSRERYRVGRSRVTRSRVGPATLVVELDLNAAFCVFGGLGWAKAKAKLASTNLVLPVLRGHQHKYLTILQSYHGVL